MTVLNQGRHSVPVNELCFSTSHHSWKIRFFKNSLSAGVTVEVEADGDTVENVPDLEVVATIAIVGECEWRCLSTLEVQILTCFSSP